MFWIQCWWHPIIHRDGIGIWLNELCTDDVIQSFHDLVFHAVLSCRGSLCGRWERNSMCGKGIFWKAKVGGQNGPTSAPAETQLESVFKETPPAVQLLWTAYWNFRCSWYMFFLDTLIWFEGVFLYSLFGSKHYIKLTMGWRQRHLQFFVITSSSFGWFRKLELTEG